MPDPAPHPDPHADAILYEAACDLPGPVPHPGRFVQRRILEGYGLSQTELARRLGVTKQSVSQLVQEKRALSTEMAMRLSALTGQSVAFWLEMQMQYDLAQLRGQTFTDAIEPLSVAPPHPR